MSTAERIHRRIVDELVRAIRDGRDDVDAEELARALVDWDSGNRSLVGLTDGCRRATYYDETVSLLHSFPVPEGELDAREEIDSRTVRARTGVYAHVRERGADGWDWLHPRFRWVTGLDLGDGVG